VKEFTIKSILRRRRRLRLRLTTSTGTSTGIDTDTDTDTGGRQQHHDSHFHPYAPSLHFFFIETKPS
jgi:hypothetical protein